MQLINSFHWFVPPGDYLYLVAVDFTSMSTISFKTLVQGMTGSPGGRSSITQVPSFQAD